MIFKMLRRISAALCGLAISGSVHAVILDISTTTPTVTVGDQLVVDVAISGLGAFGPDSLGGYDITLDFNGAILAFDSLTFGDPILGNQLDLFGIGFNFQDFAIAANTLYFTDLSFDFAADLDALQEAAFILAQITFDTIGVGSSLVAFAGPLIFLSDAIGDPLSADGGIFDIMVDVDPRGGDPTAVPAPATMALFGLGLLGLGWSRRTQA